MSTSHAGAYALMVQVDANPDAATRHAWYSWRTRDEATVRDGFEEGFRRGAQWMARTSGQLSPHFQHLAELMVWLMQRPEDTADWEAFEREQAQAPALSSNGSGDPDDPW